MKKIFMIIAVVAMAAMISSCNKKTQKAGFADSTIVERNEDVAKISSKSTKEQVKEAIAIMKEACEKKDQDMLEKGMDAYIAAINGVKSMEELEELEGPEYDIDEALSGYNLDEWADQDRLEKYEGKLEQAVEDIVNTLDQDEEDDVDEDDDEDIDYGTDDSDDSSSDDDD